MQKKQQNFQIKILLKKKVTEVVIKEVNWSLRRVQNRKPVKLNKENQKLNIGNLFYITFAKYIYGIFFSSGYD